MVRPRLAHTRRTGTQALAGADKQGCSWRQGCRVGGGSRRGRPWAVGSLVAGGLDAPIRARGPGWVGRPTPGDSCRLSSQRCEPHARRDERPARRGGRSWSWPPRGTGPTISRSGSMPVTRYSRSAISTVRRRISRLLSALPRMPTMWTVDTTQFAGSGRSAVARHRRTVRVVNVANPNASSVNPNVGISGRRNRARHPRPGRRRISAPSESSRSTFRVPPLITYASGRS
jgi:hypothetical protein